MRNVEYRSCDVLGLKYKWKIGRWHYDLAVSTNQRGEFNLCYGDLGGGKSYMCNLWWCVVLLGIQ
jgi:hypothetical protein